jgi:hypothetical protein
VLALVGCKGGDDDDVTLPTGDTDLPCTVDADGDGYCEDVDCDDNRKYTYPGADEIPYNGVDEDCDGEDLNDVDEDGYVGKAAGGDDCNDANPDIHPGAPEICYGTLDMDCDGYIPVDDCDQDGFNRRVDCDDENPDVNPDATEIWYDGVDSDCLYDSDFDKDHDSDELNWDPSWPLASWPDEIIVWNKDEVNKFKYIAKSEAKAYWTGLDCNDEDATIGGNLKELWDGVDRNCDDIIDQFHERDVIASFAGNAGIGDATFGSDITWMGDLDADGFPEVAVGDMGFNGYTGRVYILSTGAATGKAFERALADINDNAGESLLTGWGLRSAGDLTGDGVDDLLVGNSFLSEGAGTAMLFDGAKLGAGGNFGISDRIATASPGSTLSGTVITPLGDLTGDGVNEIAVSSGYWTLINGGEGTLLIGVFDGAKLGGGGDFVGTDAESLISNGTVGTSVAGGLDLDGDGALDTAMTKYGGAIDGATGGISCGGGTGSSVFLAPAAAITGGVLVDVDDFDSIAGGPCAGFTMGMSDDIDEDGYAELVVADPGTIGADSIENGGTIYLIDGDDFADGGTLSTLAMASVQSVKGATFLRTDLRYGDHDGDGIEDIIIAGPGILDTLHTTLELIPASGVGTLFYFNSATLAAGGAFDTDDANAKFLHRTVGTGMGNAWAIGDMNDDGLDDLAITAPFQGVGGTFLYTSAL